MNQFALLQTAHSQIRHLIDHLTVAVEDDGLARYIPLSNLTYSNLITALIPLSAEIKQALVLGPPEPPLLVRDVAEMLDEEVPTVCKTLVLLGYPPRSMNMAVKPEEAVAVAKHLRTA